MSTRRWAGATLGLLMGCFAVAGGCGGDDDAPPTGDAGLDGPGACSTSVSVNGCNTVSQNGQTFELGCSGIVAKTINGRAVCAGSGQCVTTPSGQQCLDPGTVYSCLQNCRPQGGDAGDAGSSPLGTSCSSNADCSGGFTCLKPTDNLAPGAGPPNGICTAECSTQANATLCKSYGGICVSFSSASNKAYCMESCVTGMVTPQEAKCHGRLDTACQALDAPGLFACIPLCATDSDCGTRKCDLASGFCTDVVTPGAPIGSPCSKDNDCAGRFCYPFDISLDAASMDGVCTATCRLGNVEACGFRTTPLDAGPPVGACLLATQSSDIGDVAICAQLCDTVNDCATNDPRWTCIMASDVRMAFGHAGYCWLGSRPDAGGPSKDASADTGAPETGAPETGVPEASPPEAGPDVAAETGVDATPDTVDNDAGDATAPDGGSD